VAQAAAEPLGARQCDWRWRRRSGSRVHRASRRHCRSDFDKRCGGRKNAGRMLHGGTARARVRSRRQHGCRMGRPPCRRQVRVASSNHGISIDNKGNIWIGGNGSPPATDSHILKFTHDGKFLMQIGKPGIMPASKRHDALRTRREDFVRLQCERSVHRRRLRQQARRGARHEHGAIKRYWGAYGNVPSDSNYGAYNPMSRSFRNSGILCTAPIRRTMDWCMCAIA